MPVRDNCSDEDRYIASQGWEHLHSRRPQLYLADCKPHGECDPRVEHGRHLWSSKDLDRFASTIEERTKTLLNHQNTVFLHWHRAATVIQAHVRGLISRRRVQNIQQALYEAAQTAARAKDRAALLKRQLDAAILIQTVYHRHCEQLHHKFACRLRLQRSLRLYCFRRMRLRAALVIQQAFRRYRRRVRLWKALRTVVRLLRMSRRYQELETLAAEFRKARSAAVELERLRMCRAYPDKMAQAKRVGERKLYLRNIAGTKAALNTLLPRLQRPQTLERSHRYPKKGSGRHWLTLPRLEDCQ